MNWVFLAAAAGGLFVVAALLFAYFRTSGKKRRRRRPKAAVRASNGNRKIEGGQRDFEISPVFLGKVAAAYLAILIAIAGAGLLGYQSVAWFDSGMWPSLSVADAMHGVMGSGWPSSGNVSGALEWVPFGAVMLLGALGCLAVVFREDA